MVRRRSALGLPPHCERFTTKGITYVYARLPGGPRIRLLSPLGSEAFTYEYRAAIDKLRGPIGQDLGLAKGSVRAIATAYLASPEFARLSPSARKTYRREIERFATKNAPRMLGDLASDDIRSMMRKIASPHTARSWRQALSSVCRWAVDRDLLRRNPLRSRRAEMSRGDAAPALDARACCRLPRRPSDRDGAAAGARVRALHDGAGTVGYRPHDALQHQGRQRRMDGAEERRADVRPVAVELQAEIDAAPRDDLLFFRTLRGSPMSAHRFGVMVARAVAEAGLPPDLTAHGLRHAGASEAAENGASVPEIAALLGDRSWKMAQRYASQAERPRMIADYHARRAKKGT